MNLAELRVLAMTDLAFSQADALAEFLASLAPAFGSSLYLRCSTGMVISYCRPFLEVSGQTSFPEEMSHLTNPVSKLPIMQ